MLTARGLHAIGLATGTGIGQRKSWHPSDSRLAHWLAIGDVYVGLVEASRRSDLKILKFAAEADALRVYPDEAGRTCVIRPDAFIRLLSRGVELLWFVEVDRSTENPKRIADKCRAYRAYELADLEYQRYRAFPGVMFIVPDEQRKKAIARVISAQPEDARGLFWVATRADAIKTLLGPEF